MDLFAGSEPREIISFHLDKEQDGQPSCRESTHLLEPNVPNSVQQACQEPAGSSEPEKVLSILDSPEIEDALQGNLTIDLESNEPGSEMLTSASPQIANVQREEVVGIQLSIGANLESELMETSDAEDANMIDPPTAGQSDEPHKDDVPLESGSSQESCQTLFTRRMEELGGSEYDLPVEEVTILGAKGSQSESIELTRGLNVSTCEDSTNTAPLAVSFLDPDHNYVADPRLRRGRVSPLKPAVNVKTASPPNVTESQDRAGQDSTMGEDDVFITEVSQFDVETECLEGHMSESNLSLPSNATSLEAARSTLADALLDRSVAHLSPTDISSGTDADQSTCEQNVRGPEAHQLSNTSRAIINHYFEETSPIELPRGHPTIALSFDQMQSILRVVADESARASYAMMEDLIERARRLNLNTVLPARPNSSAPYNRASVPDSDAGSMTDRETGRAESLTSGALRSDDDSNSIGYTFERTPPSIVAISLPPRGFPVGIMDPTSSEPHQQVASPGSQTLAALKEEAQRDQQSKGRKTKVPSKPRTARRRVTRSCKIMKEEYFEGMAWTKTFVSGPVDPKWNKYKFYCQICKGNVSIFGKGAREILRHYSTEKHLRKDQRWRYEHLSTVDPLTNAVQHQVRGKDGKVLTPYQLELELPLFIDAELVDIGEKLPFYHEFMAGAQHMASSSDNRARVQISILGHYLPTFGDIRALRGLWKDIGVVVNHQALFADFNWGKERLSVSIQLWLIPH